MNTNANTTHAIRVMAKLIADQGLAPAVAVAAAEILDAQNLAPQHVKQAYALAPFAEPRRRRHPRQRANGSLRLQQRQG